MFNKKILASAIAMAGGLVAQGALAQTDIDDYMINFEDAALIDAGTTSPGGTAINNLQNVDEWKFTAFSIVGFFDQDNNGEISAGDIFQDFVLLRVDQFQNAFGDDITPGNYGGAGSNHEITIKTEFAGFQVTNTTYLVNEQRQFDIIFDAGTGAGYTTASMSNVGSFSDGIVVETGNFVNGGGTNNAPTAPDGTIDLTNELTDLLTDEDCGAGAGSCDNFELRNDGSTLSMNSNFVAGIADANNLGQFGFGLAGLGTPGGLPPYNPGNALQSAQVDHIDAEFASLGCAGTTCSYNGSAFDFWFFTKSDGSFNKQFIVPLPGSIALMGIGMLGLGFQVRRLSKRS